ncbi:MAG: hypothetical protein K5989_08760, partial [Lachnospiraceae bacterium]|nr:hypothetical protein [Lachnospiraceae bacterium]
MRKRSRKLLSLFVAASMVFSMNALTFAAEQEGQMVEIGTENLEEADFSLEELGTEITGSAASAKAEGSEAVTDAAAAAEAVILTDTPSTAGDPISWNSVFNGDVMAPLFQYHINGSTSDHVANGQKYEVSANGGANGKRNVLFGYYDEDGRPCFNESVSSNVFTVPQKGKNA